MHTHTHTHIHTHIHTHTHTHTHTPAKHMSTCNYITQRTSNTPLVTYLYTFKSVGLIRDVAIDVHGC